MCAITHNHAVCFDEGTTQRLTFCQETLSSALLIHYLWKKQQECQNVPAANPLKEPPSAPFHQLHEFKRPLKVKQPQCHYAFWIHCVKFSLQQELSLTHKIKKKLGLWD